MLDIKNGQGYP